MAFGQVWEPSCGSASGTGTSGTGVTDIGPSCDRDAAGPVGASCHGMERLCDMARNYDPRGGTGRFKSPRPDHYPHDRVIVLDFSAR